MNWTTILNHLFAYLAGHVGTEEFVGWSVITAVIVNMPEPGSPFSWRTLYAWLYNTLHQFANTRTVNSARPTIPANPDKQ